MFQTFAFHNLLTMNISFNMFQTSNGVVPEPGQGRQRTRPRSGRLPWKCGRRCLAQRDFQWFFWSDFFFQKKGGFPKGSLSKWFESWRPKAPAEDWGEEEDWAEAATTFPTDDEVGALTSVPKSIKKIYWTLLKHIKKNHGFLGMPQNVSNWGHEVPLRYELKWS